MCVCMYGKIFDRLAHLILLLSGHCFAVGFTLCVCVCTPSDIWSFVSAGVSLLSSIVVHSPPRVSVNRQIRRW